MDVKFFASYLSLVCFLLANIGSTSSAAGSRSDQNKANIRSVDTLWDGADGREAASEFVSFISSLGSQEIGSAFRKFQIPWYSPAFGTRKNIWGDGPYFSARLFQERNEGKRDGNSYFENGFRKGKLLQIVSSETIKLTTHGCEDERGFHFEGDTWYSRGCRRHNCVHFRGKYFIETDSCDVEIFNTTYKCIVQANLKENYPNCCPRYNCNPDNLGNRIHVASR